MKDNEHAKALLSDLITQDVQVAVLFLLALFFVLTLVGGGFILGLICLVRKLQGKPMIHKFYSQQIAPWNFGDVIKLAILFYFWSIITGILFGLINEFILKQSTESLVVLTHTFVMDCAILGFIIYFVKSKYKKPLTEIGLNDKNIISDVFLGFSSYCAVLPLLIVVIAVLSYIVTLIKFEPPPHPLVDIFVAEDKQNPTIIYLSIILACTIGPIIEEIFFRGFCYTAMKKHLGIKGAMVFTAAFFALIHYSAFAFFPIFILGMVLVYLYEKRGTLIPSITLHVVHNCLFIGYFFMVKRIILDNVR